MPLLEDSYRVIAIDLPGYGTSSPLPVTDGAADMDAMAWSVFHVLDALGIERAHVGGIHTGAHVGVRAAVHAPERVGALVLIGYPLVENDAEIADFNSAGNYEHITRFAGRERAPDGRHLMKLWADAYSQVVKNWILKGGPVDERTPEIQLRVPSAHRRIWTFLTEHEMEVVHRYFEDALHVSNMAPIYAAMIQPSADLLARVEAPTLHVDPASVYESPYCQRGDRVAELMPNCRNVRLEGTDDNMPEFDAPRLTDAMRDFLSEHRLESSVGASGERT
jgi:pimeloyl-ACP methyl ester carboxylesterase